MSTDSLNGQWWIHREGTRTLERLSRTRRTGRAALVRKSLDAQHRQYKCITDAANADARDPDASELWFDPIEGRPTAQEDWLVGAVDVSFDIEGGRAEIRTTAVSMPADWSTVKLEHSTV